MKAKLQILKVWMKKNLPFSLQKSIYLTSGFMLSFVFYHRQSSQKNILLFSTRRGGSTWLGQLVCANKGIRYIGQPLTAFTSGTAANQLSSKKKSRYLPTVDQFQYISLSKKAQTRLQSYAELLLKGKISLNTLAEYRLSSKKYWFFTDRIFLKITDANAMIDWFAKNFDCRIIYLMRHPIPNVLSIMKNKWEITSSTYLNNESFIEKYMDNDVLTFCWRIMESNDYFLQGILNWCLENLIPLKHSKSDFLTITYEELVLSPKPVVKMFSDYLNLSQTDRMYGAIDRPSASSVFSKKSTAKAISENLTIKDKYLKLIANWKNFVSRDQEKKAWEILNNFGLCAYSFGSALPDKK